MDLSRDTFYRYNAAVEDGGDALIDRYGPKPHVKNRCIEFTEKAVAAYAIEQPAHGQVRGDVKTSSNFMWVRYCWWYHSQ